MYCVTGSFRGDQTTAKTSLLGQLKNLAQLAKVVIDTVYSHYPDTNPVTPALPKDDLVEEADDVPRCTGYRHTCTPFSHASKLKAGFVFCVF